MTIKLRKPPMKKLPHEKLRDDILDTCEPITSVTKQEWADRLTAIMERDA